MAAFYSNDATNGLPGVDPEILALKGVKITGAFPQQRRTARGVRGGPSHNWALGQRIQLAGLEAGTIVGLLGPTHGRMTLHLPALTEAQALLHRPGELTHVLVRLDDQNALDQVVRQLADVKPVSTMNIVPLAICFIRFCGRNSTVCCLACIAVVAFRGGFWLCNTVLMSVTSVPVRSCDAALGASQGQVFRLFWAEALQMCLFGAALGCLSAYAAASLVEAWLRSRLPLAPAQP